MLPNGREEERLAAIVTDVLGIERIHRDDSLFAHGGHSLAASRVAARVIEEFGVAVAFAQFLREPTVAGLTRLVAEARPTGQTSLASAAEHPLTSLQRHMWALRQISAAAQVTTVAERLLVRGVTDSSAFRRALDRLVERHEMLRTAIEPGPDGVPVGRVRPPAPVQVSEVDGRDDSADEVRRTFAAQAFDLAADVPLLRALLLHGADGPDTTEVVVVVDHLAFDGASLGALMVELAQELAGEEVAAPPVRFADGVHMMERSPDEAAVAGYWRTELAGVVPPYDLPGEARNGPVRHHGARVTRIVEPDLVAAVGAFAGRHAVTAFAAYAAAMAVVLDGLTGRPDHLLGVPAVVRDRPGTERIIGPLLDMLPVRVDLCDDPDFAEAARRALGATHRALAHRPIAVSDLLRLSGVQRPPGAPLTPVVLSPQPPDVPVAVSRGTVRVELLGAMDTGAAQNELTVYVNPTVTGTQLIAEYDTDRFDAPAMEAFLGRLLRVLAGGVAAPERRISSFELVDVAEREWLLAAGDGGPLPADVPRTVVHAILAQATARPDAVAVVGRAGTQTYAELVAVANRIAALLRARGVTPGEPVGACLPRDHLLPAALLGVLLAGCAYLPLEADLPPERLRYLVGSGGVRYALVSPATATQLTGMSTVELVEVGDQAGASDAPLAEQLPEPDQLAYVLYTSGSTGRPKGVEITHASLAAYLAAMRGIPGYGREDVFLAVAPLSFDLSCFEIWCALAVGARTVVVDRATAVDGPALVAVADSAGVTAMLVTPATLRLFSAAGWKGGPAAKVISAGEVLDAGLAADLLTRTGQLWNGYGPTEATVTVTAQRVAPPLSDPVPIGRPTPGDRLYVLDTRGRLAPPGVPGELWIGGAGVARGYRNQPELTAAAFTDDSYVPGGRRYRTGDLVRWRADGALEYLGRRDHQVKLRGYRIELAEIESVLREHPSVRDALVAVERAGTPDAFLVAHLIGEAPRPAAVPTADIEAYARQRLPGYMVPLRWNRLDEVPLTSAGKVDRRALPVLGQAGADFVAPRTEVERFVAELWADVLGVDAVGLGDDFFALGGHSLAATRVTSRIAERLDCPLPVALLFDEPVLGGYAAEVERLLLAQLDAEDEAVRS